MAYSNPRFFVWEPDALIKNNIGRMSKSNRRCDMSTQKLMLLREIQPDHKCSERVMSFRIDPLVYNFLSLYPLV